MASIAAIYRYPVKGLSAERLAHAELQPGGVIPFDRAYAIENGTRDFQPEAPRYFPKLKYLMLMRDERLASLSTVFDEATHMLLVERAGRVVVRGKLDTVVGRQLIEQFLAVYMKDALRGPPRIVTAENFSFSDAPAKLLSIVNEASVADLARVVGSPVDPLRFRANLLVEGLEPWAEKAFVGRRLAIGPVELEVVDHIVRCAATNVNPRTAQRDLNLPLALERAFGANRMGVYARVVSAGRIAQGDALAVS